MKGAVVWIIALTIVEALVEPCRTSTIFSLPWSIFKNEQMLVINEVRPLLV
jgi:hypothetical protein